AAERAVDVLEIAERQDLRQRRDAGSDPHLFQRIHLAEPAGLLLRGVPFQRARAPSAEGDFEGERAEHEQGSEHGQGERNGGIEQPRGKPEGPAPESREESDADRDPDVRQQESEDHATASSGAGAAFGAAASVSGSTKSKARRSGSRAETPSRARFIRNPIAVAVAASHIGRIARKLSSCSANPI